MTSLKLKSVIFGAALASLGHLAIAADSAKDPAAKVPVDNSAINSRDVRGGPLTPEDQANDKRDLDLSAKIRQALVEDDKLSTYAKNVKIIASGGVVTLRGPVHSQAEKDSIAAKANQIAGSGKVVNQLEIKTN